MKFEEARKLVDDKYDIVKEYDDAWHFTTEEAENNTGVDQGFVIMKDTGEKLLLHEYVLIEELMPIDENEGVIFRFNRGSFFEGTLKYTIKETLEGLLFEGKNYNKSGDGPNYSFIIPAYTAKELFSIVKKTKNWKAGYNVVEDTLDGYGWEIKLKYGKLNIETEGYETFPMDFKTVVSEIQEKIEKICEIYAENYTKDGIKERMDL